MKSFPTLAAVRPPAQFLLSLGLAGLLLCLPLLTPSGGASWIGLAASVLVAVAAAFVSLAVTFQNSPARPIPLLAAMGALLRLLVSRLSAAPVTTPAARFLSVLAAAPTPPVSVAVAGRVWRAPSRRPRGGRVWTHWVQAA